MEYELYHHGVKGMKWGVRKNRKPSSKEDDVSPTNKRRGLTDNQKRALKVGAAVAGTALATYGAYKLSKFAKQKAYAKSLARGKDAIEKCMESFDNKNVYPWHNKNLPLDKIETGLRKSDALRFKLGIENRQYAERSSKNTARAVKTLLNKNHELPLADLVRMGIVDADTVIKRSWIG